jgi:antirestriction protein ArdC
LLPVRPWSGDRVLREVDGKPSTASRRRLAAARALPTLLHWNARENGLPQGYMGDIWLAYRQRTSAPTRRPPSQVGEQTSPCTTASFSRLTLVRLR